MHPCQENWVAIGRAVVNYARVAQAFSTGIKCWHCTYAIIYLYLYNCYYFAEYLEKWRHSTGPYGQKV